jgi:predicted nucleic acid-binding protein
MIIVVDTNIIFSAILNSQSNIGNILLNNGNFFTFYSVKYLKYEINNHIEKICKITKRNPEEIYELVEFIYDKIIFISDDLIPKSIKIKADALTCDVDFDDVMFIALSLHLNCSLWTGDKTLIEKLRKKGFNNFITTEMMKQFLSQ